jgi:transcriptional regulator with XRE-family HTH domain
MERRNMTTKSFAALYAKLESTPAYQAEKLAVAFLAELNAFMQAHDVSNAELARRAGVSPAYITKVFRGPSNLSLETLTKLAEAVGSKVHLHLANNGADVRWFDVFQQQRTFKREIEPGAAHFMQTMSQLKPIDQEKFVETCNDEKFALAA